MNVHVRPVPRSRALHGDPQFQGAAGLFHRAQVRGGHRAAGHGGEIGPQRPRADQRRLRPAGNGARSGSSTPTSTSTSSAPTTTTTSFGSASCCCTRTRFARSRRRWRRAGGRSCPCACISRVRWSRWRWRWPPERSSSTSARISSSGPELRESRARAALPPLGRMRGTDSVTRPRSRQHLELRVGLRHAGAGAENPRPADLDARAGPGRGAAGGRRRRPAARHGRGGGRRVFPVPASRRSASRYRIAGEVPPARGLGSSATVRTGVLAGLNALAGAGLPPRRIVELGTALEGHPDNAAAGGARRVLRVPHLSGRTAPISTACASRCRAELAFVVVAPRVAIHTRESRGALPRTLPFFDAVRSINAAAFLVAAICHPRFRQAAAWRWRTSCTNRTGCRGFPAGARRSTPASRPARSPAG